MSELARLRDQLPQQPDPAALVFMTADGTPPLRATFRRTVWRPALVRASLLGKVEEATSGRSP